MGRSLLLSCQYFNHRVTLTFARMAPIMRRLALLHSFQRWGFCLLVGSRYWLPQFAVVVACCIFWKTRNTCQLLGKRHKKESSRFMQVPGWEQERLADSPMKLGGWATQSKGRGHTAFSSQAQGLPLVQFRVRRVSFSLVHSRWTPCINSTDPPLHPVRNHWFKLQ